MSLSCHRCKYMARGVQGKVPCVIDGIDIASHWQDKYCPDPSGPRFGTNVYPAVWVYLSRPTLPIPPDYKVDNYKEGGCGCSP